MAISMSRLSKPSGFFVVESFEEAPSSKLDGYLVGYWQSTGAYDEVPVISGARNIRLVEGSDLPEFNRVFVDLSTGFPVVTKAFLDPEDSSPKPSEEAKPSTKGKSSKAKPVSADEVPY